MEEKNIKKRDSKRVVFWRKIFYGFFLLFLGAIILSLITFIYLIRDFPRPERLTERPLTQPTRIYDRTGEVILFTVFGEERREVVPLDSMPLHLRQAVMAAEDDNFYNHIGIDFKGMLRALIINIRKGGIFQGGSTISQQLVRSTFLTGERTITRKIREIVLTIELERRYSKDKILELYLNQIPFGGNAYGVEIASQKFFNKSVSDINIAESAILAALIRSPSRLSPFGENKERLFTSKDRIINRMGYLGFISTDDVIKYTEKRLDFSRTGHLLRAPHFTLEVIDYLMEKYGEDYLRTMGLKIYTTIDWDLQQKAEKIILERSKTNRFHRSHNSSLVAIDPQTGEILAMVGSTNFFSDPYPENCIPGKNCLFEPYPNIATRLRQPGSAFKSFVYASALKKGYDDGTIIIDEPINIAGYSPSNYDGLFRGPVTLREALSQSLNVPAVRVLAELTNIESVIDLSKNFGITTLTKSPLFYGLPLALGVGEVTLLEMTSAYGVFASRGYSVLPSSILKITNSDGDIIKENTPSRKRVLNSNVAEMISSILADNSARAPVFGANSALNIPGVSSKTGTTQNYNDGWIIGYNSSLVVGVWSGNNDNTPMISGPGLVVSAPIWREFFEYYLQK